MSTTTAMTHETTEQDYSRSIFGSNCKRDRREDETVFLCDYEKW
jgi:hypothetical protein